MKEYWRCCFIDSSGNSAHIYPGAHVLGGINVGDNSIIGAMTLDIKDVEPGVVGAGISARVIRLITNKG